MKSIFFHIFDLTLSDLYVVSEIYLMNKQTQVSSKTTVYILANIPYFFPSPQKWNTLFLPWFWHPKLCFDVDINISGWPNFSNKKFQNFYKNSKAHFSKIPRLRTEHHSVLPPELSSAGWEVRAMRDTRRFQEVRPWKTLQFYIFSTLGNIISSTLGWFS